VIPEGITRSRTSRFNVARFPAARQHVHPGALDSFGTDSRTIPGYHGILERALTLVRAADRKLERDPEGNVLKGDAEINAIITTLPTNQRYAAVYKPYHAPDRHVVVLDWGFVSGLIGLAVCFSRCATMQALDASPDADGHQSIVIDSPFTLSTARTRRARQMAQSSS
jgi:hypothetical protein